MPSICVACPLAAFGGSMRPWLHSLTHANRLSPVLRTSGQSGMTLIPIELVLQAYIPAMSVEVTQ